mgnify:CR=1 FL=1
MKRSHKIVIKVFLISTATLLLLVGGLLLTIGSGALNGPIARIVSTQGSLFLNGKLTVGSIDGNLLNNFTINQIELERLIDNNISNGIKYADIDKPMTVILERDNDIVSLTFKTFGKPIQNTSKLFDKNYRENNGKRGLGIGLFMVKNICEKYDIAYDVSYEDGQNIFSYSFKV